MSYMALYRKFRPQSFEQVKGQDHVVRALKNQVKTGRIGHAYLFTGTRGTGKTSVAKIFAKAINCLSPVDGEPCGTCENCKAVAADAFIDIVEIDAASNTGVDDIRQIIEEVQYTPTKGRYKVYIIDEAHMLTTAAFNAFLKTLEEPPSYVVFILATTEPHKLPITILSRCQRYDFHRISDEEITANLSELCAKEEVEAERKALEYVAKAGDGSMRDSISLLDKCIAFNLGEKLTYDNVLQTLGAVDTEIFSNIFRAVHAGDAVSALSGLESAVKDGKDLGQFISDFIWYIRNVLIAKVSGDASGKILGVTKENLKALEEDARMANEETLMRYIRVLSNLLGSMKFSSTKQIQAEVAFIKLAKPETESSIDSLSDRLRHLESGAPAVPGSARIVYEPEYESAEAFAPEPEPIVSEPEPFIPEPFVPEHEPVAFEERSVAKASGGTVANSWQDIISATQNQRLKFSLKKAAVTEEEENSVVIGSEAEVSVASIREHIDELKDTILKVTGRNVEVTVRVASGSPAPTVKAPAANAPANDELLKNINFKIETEDF